MDTYNSLIEAGYTPVMNPPPIVTGGRSPVPAPPAPATSMPRALVGTIPAEFQLDADLANQQYGGGVPTMRLFPTAPNGKAAPNSSILSQVAPVKRTTQIVEQAVATQPVVTTGTDPTGTPIVHVTPPLPGPPRPRLPVTPTHVPVVRGVNNSRVSYDSLLGDTSGDTTTDFVDGANKRFLHDAMSGPTQSSIDPSAGGDGSYIHSGVMFGRHLSGASSSDVSPIATNTGDLLHTRMSSATQGVIDITTAIKSTAPVIGHPSPNIGTALAKLNGSGLLLNADQVAADGVDYLRRPQNSGSAIVLDNANFVAGTSGWTISGAAATIAQDTTAPTTNGKSLKTTTATQFNGALHVATFKASPGDVFFMSAWMKSDGVFQPKFQISYLDGSGAFLASDGIGYSTSTTWAQYTATGGAAPANTATVQILFVRVDSGVLSQSAWLAEPHVVRVASLDNEVGDGTTYNRFKAANMHNGGASPLHVITQLPTINLGVNTVILSPSAAMVAGWQLLSSTGITIPPGTNSITFVVTTGFAGSGAGAHDPSQVGLAIYSGAAPGTPQVSGTLTATTTLTVPNPPSGNVTLGVYTNNGAGVHLDVAGAIGIPTVLVVNGANIT